MTDLDAVATGLSELRTAARTASLAADDDPTLRERVDSALDRMTKIEETIAYLMDADVEDVPMHAEGDTPAPVAAGLAPPFKKKGAKGDDESPTEDADPADEAEHPEPDTDEMGGKSDGDADNKPPKPPKPSSGNTADDDTEGISNVADLHNAIRAIGNAPDRDAERARIKRRARAIGAESELPDGWE